MELIMHLRILTVTTVENIVAWKDYLFNLQKYTQKPDKFSKSDNLIVFFFDNENYIIKIRSDTQFIIDSVLNSYIPISPKYDPFFVYPSKKL